MLRDHGIIPENCTRAYVGKAVTEFADQIVCSPHDASKETGGLRSRQK
jgi:hypothetical protein